jgi:hypothetical protein
MSETKQRHFIPSPPGFWEPSYFGRSQRRPRSYCVPVVAWEMVDDGVSGDEHVHYAYPVTTFGEVTGRGHNAILGPDGRVRVARGAT